MYDQSKLSELTRFARVDAGSTVIDVYPGDGDWTRLFSDAVGPEGRVYSFVPTEIADFKNDSVGRMRTLANEPGRENVEIVSADLVALPEVTQPADVLWMHLFYHDLHTALIQAKGATAADFNRAVYERLKPGGSYVIVDHAAAVGSGTSDVQSLHRIDPASVREEVEAAGFVLDAQNTLLANKDDPYSVKVFDPSIKGETDRFAYLQQVTGLLWTVGGYRKLLRAEYAARAPEVEARYPAAIYGSPAAAWAALVTDEDFACPTAQTARLLAPQVPVRLYLFDDTHAPSRLPRLPFFPRLGAYHALETAYVLQRPWILADPSRFDAGQRRLSDAMQDAWGRFARTGELDASGQPDWPQPPFSRRLAPDASGPEAVMVGRNCGSHAGTRRLSAASW